MTRLLDISAGRILLKNTSGTTVFDTDEKQFIVTDYKTGSTSFSSFSASNTNAVDIGAGLRTDTNSLGSVNSFADTVRGAFFVTTAGQGQLFNLGWFNASGSYLHLFLGTPGPFTSGNVGLGAVVTFTFSVSSGTLSCVRHAKAAANWSTSSSVTNSITVNAVTLNYKLFCGTFV